MHTFEMKKRGVDVSVVEFIYLLYIAVMFGARAVGLYEGQLLYNVTLIIGASLFAEKVLVTKHSLLEYAIIAVLCGICIIIYRNTGEKGVLLCMTMMLGMKGVSLEKIIREETVILGGCFIFKIIFSILEIFPEQLFGPFFRSGFGEVYRHTLGYPHPNTMMTTFIILMVLICYIGENNNSKCRLIVESIYFFSIAIFLYVYSCSKTGLLMSVVYLLFRYWGECRHKLKKWERQLFYLIYLGILLGSIAGPILLAKLGRVFEILDAIFLDRLELSYHYLTEESITWFGVRFQPFFLGNYPGIIDNSHLYSFMQLGVVMFCILTFLNLALVYAMIKENNIRGLVIVLTFWILGISDPFLYNLSFKNILFLFMGKYLYEYLGRYQSKRQIREYQIIPIERVFSVKIPVFNMSVFEDVLKVKNLILYLGVLAITFLVCILFGNIYDTMDNVIKWEWYRKIMSFGYLVAGLSVLIMTCIMRYQKNGEQV